MVTRSVAPPMVWEAAPPSVVWGLIGNPPPSSVLGCGGWESLPPFSRVVRGLVGAVGGNSPPSSLWCGVWWGRDRAGKGRIRGPSRVGFSGGREASLVHQTTFCGRRRCSENLGCPFRCFGRPWRFLLGTIQYRAIKSVLMTSRPQKLTIHCAIYYTRYTLEFVLYTIDYILYTWSIYIR